MEEQINDILEELENGDLSDFNDSDEDDNLDELEEIIQSGQNQQSVSSEQPLRADPIVLDVEDVQNQQIAKRIDQADQSLGGVGNNDVDQSLEENYLRLQWQAGNFQPSVPLFVVSQTDSPDPTKTPYMYFKDLITDDMITLLTDQTNLYSTQKTGLCINTTKGEMEQVLGIYLRMGLVQLPSVRSYWETHLKYNLVADVLPRNRFEKLLTFLHFANNLDDTNNDRSNDKLWKLRPWLNSFREACLRKEPEESHSVDEMMIAFKGKSYLRQYMQNKPTKWGFKIWGRAGVSGYLYDFDVYQGACANNSNNRQSVRQPGRGFGYQVVKQLSDTLPADQNFKLFADNFFTTDILVQYLLKRSIYFVGTVRTNRLQDCNLPDDKEMKKMGRGSSVSMVDSTGKFGIVKWFDNKSVTLLSSMVGTEPVDTVQRYDKARKTYIVVVRPAIIKSYNQFMGGVDLHDMLCSLYKYHIKSRRWYLYILWHTVTVAVVNSWLRYRNDLREQNLPHLPLRKFQAEVATALVTCGKLKRVGRPSIEDMMSKRKKKAPTTVRPVLDTQKDKCDHWPLFKQTRGRCKICYTLNSNIFCSKCEVYLCLNRDRNCFQRFHV